MKIRSVIAAAALAIGTTLAGLVVSTPAQAARADWDEMWRGDFHYQAWVNNTNNTIRLKSEVIGFHIDFYEYDTAGNRFVLYVDAGRDWTWYLPRPVSLWRICGPNGAGADHCTRWHNLDR